MQTSITLRVSLEFISFQPYCEVIFIRAGIRNFHCPFFRDVARCSCQLIAEPNPASASEANN